MKELKIDPEFKSLIPPLTSEEFQQLKENCTRDGIRDPIVTWNGCIVDGHNRYQIAQESGLDFKTESMEFPDRNAARIWIVKNQLGRRNLPAATRILLAKKVEPEIRAKAKEQQIRKPKSVSTNWSEQIDTDREIAKLSNTSEGAVKRFNYVQKHGTPETIKSMEAGEISINRAKQLSSPTPAEQARQERQELQKSNMVSFSDVKQDKDNQELTALDLYNRLLRCGNGIDGIAYFTKSNEITEMINTIGIDKCKPLIESLKRWQGVIISIQMKFRRAGRE